MTSRRHFLGTASATVAGSLLLSSGSLFSGTSAAANAPGAMLRRPIPSSGEKIPVIGMGTSGSFQVPPDSAEYQALKEVLKRFFDGGASLILYGDRKSVV